MADPSLFLVSNRGPVTFGPDGQVVRGTGGLRGGTRVTIPQAHVPPLAGGRWSPPGQ